MTQLNELINKHIDSIKFNGCQLSKEMLTLMFDGVVALAKIQESFEINQKYLESIGTAFGNGGNDQVERILEEFNPTTNKPIEVIGQHITEPESIFIRRKDMVEGNWYIGDSEAFDDWLFKFKSLHGRDVKTFKSANDSDDNIYVNLKEGLIHNVYNIRPATIEEVTKYFPNEFESNVTEHPNKY
jgi:hypothetical protein